MNKFNRIVHEAMVMGGQARIRDTEITVNEIVQMSLDGQSQADILAKFTELEVEDVHQAMGWQIKHLNDETDRFAASLRSPLTSIIGYADILPAVIESGKNPDGILEMISVIKKRAIYRKSR